MVLLDIEKMSEEVIGNQTSAPLNQELLQTRLLQDDYLVPLGAHSHIAAYDGHILTPASVPYSQAWDHIKGIRGDQLIVRNKKNEIMGRIWSLDAFRFVDMTPQMIGPRAVVIDCLHKSSHKNRMEMLSFHQLYGLAPCEFMTLEEFKNNPDGMTGRNTFPDEEHTNWELLATVSSFYHLPVRKCMADIAYAISCEVVLFYEWLSDCATDIPAELFDREDFDFVNVTSILHALCDADEVVSEELNKLVPLLFSIEFHNKPTGKSSFLPTYDPDTYERVGAPEIPVLQKKGCKNILSGTL